MIDIRSLFDYFSGALTIEYHRTKLAIFYNSDEGPSILYEETIKHHVLSSDATFLRNFAVSSMIATTQSSIYRDEVILIPVARYPGYHALVMAVVIPGAGPIHARYFQLVIFLPDDVVAVLPNTMDLRGDLLRMAGRLNYSKLNEKDMINFKLRLLRNLDCKIIEC